MVNVRVEHIENAVSKHFEIVSTTLVDALVSPVRGVSHGSNQHGILAFSYVLIIFEILLDNAKVNKEGITLMNPKDHGLNVSVDVPNLMKLLNCLKHLY